MVQEGGVSLHCDSCTEGPGTTKVIIHFLLLQEIKKKKVNEIGKEK